jgi:hypothetical protein
MGYSKKQKRRLKKAIMQRKKDRLNRAWRSIWVKAGVLREEM